MLRELNQELLAISPQLNIDKKEKDSQTAPYVAIGSASAVMKEAYSQNER